MVNFEIRVGARCVAHLAGDIDVVNRVHTRTLGAAPELPRRGCRIRIYSRSAFGPGASLWYGYHCQVSFTPVDGALPTWVARKTALE